MLDAIMVSVLAYLLITTVSTKEFPYNDIFLSRLYGCDMRVKEFLLAASAAYR